jgi:hypothetical protein
MKTIILMLLNYFLLVFTQISPAQNPTYLLDVNDRTSLNNEFEFDIEMTWTNPGVAPNFEYAGADYHFDFNKQISNGGNMTLAIVESDLPINMRPRNPTVYTVTTPGQLRLAVNTFPGAGNGYVMPPNIAVRIVRLRLRTTAPYYANETPDLVYRSSSPNPYINVFAYVGTTNTDITTPATHIMSIPNLPFPNFPNISLSIPPTGSEIVSQPIQFAWHPIANARTYTIQISSNPDMLSYLLIDSLITDTTRTISALLQRDLLHYWRVIAKDSNNQLAGASAIWSFTPTFSIYLTVKCAVQAMLIPIPGTHARRDTFAVYLRNNLSPYQIVDSAKAVIDSVTLTGNFNFVTAPTGNYYIVVRHFNSIETWSKSGGEFLQTGIQNNYDFTSAITQAYGNNLKLRAGKYCFYSGDVNQSGFVEGTDFMRIANGAYNFEVGPRLPEDLDASGLVDATDFSIVDNNSLFFIGTISPLNSLDGLNDKIVEP